ncbi:MAG: caspase family protein [Bacteroidota bacterium]
MTRFISITLIYSLLILGVSAVEAQRLNPVVQKGHYATIKSVAFTPDGKYLLTGSRDKTIKLWEIASGRELRTFFGHTSTINDISVSSDGKFFISSSADQTAKMWEITTGKLIKSFNGHNDYLTSVDISNDNKLLLTSGFDTQAYLWDISSSQVIDTFKVNPEKGLGYGTDARFNPRYNQIAFGNDNKTVTIHNERSEQPSYELKPENGWCGGCATFIDYSTDGKYLLSGSKDGPFKLIDTGDGTTFKTFEEEYEEYTSVEINSEASRALLVGEDSIRLYDVQKAKLIYKIKANHSAPVNDGGFSPDGNMIVTVGDDQTITLYNTEDGSVIKSLMGFLQERDKGGLDYDPNSRWDYYIKKYTDLRNDIRISPNGQYLVKAKIGSLVRMWDLKSGILKNEFRGHDKAVLCMEFSKDGKYLLTGSADKTAKLWDINTGKVLKTFKDHFGEIFTVAFSADGTKIATGSWDSTAKIWDIESGELLTTLRFESASPYELKFFRNDIYLLISQLDKTVKLWEIDSKREVKEFIGHTDVIHSIDFNKDQSLLATSSWDGKVKMWEVGLGLQKYRLEDHDGPVYAAKFSPTDNYLATSGSDRKIKLRNASNGNVIRELIGHESSVTSLQFTPDEANLVSASEDGVIKIWDIGTGSELISYIILDKDNWMVLNKDGYFNFTGDALKNIIFVDGLKHYETDQFFDRFYQPELLKNTFGAKKETLNLRNELKNSPPPSIEIISPKSNQVVESGEMDFLLKVTDEGGGVGSVEFLHNGKNVANVTPEFKKSKSTYVNQQITLIPGKNTIEISAINKKGIRSAKKSLILEGDGQPESILYLFAVGINKYKNPRLNLNYAKADASGFVEVIKDKSSSLFDMVEVITLSDELATKDNILSELTVLTEKIRPQDVLLFYFAGHGSMLDNNFYFIPTDATKLYNEDKLKKDALYAGDLQQKLKDIPALKQLLIIDACQSGAGAELLAQRGASEEKALAQLSRSTGIHVLAAAGSEQFATEFKELGHGLFTYVLLEALKGEADGAPNDGKVTIFELRSYLEDQVPEYSKKYKGQLQFPNTFSRGQDFPIVIDEEE